MLLTARQLPADVQRPQGDERPGADEVTHGGIGPEVSTAEDRGEQARPVRVPALEPGYDGEALVIGQEALIWGERFPPDLDPQRWMSPDIADPVGVLSPGRADDRRMVRKLEAAPVTMADGTPRAYLAVRDKAMHRLGVGTTHDMKSVLSGIFWPSLRSPQYTAAEKMRLWRGKLSSGVSVLWDEMLATDLAGQVSELSVPAYFFHGVYDYTENYQLARDYAQRLKAPVKGFYSFDRSAHSPILEEPEKVRRIMREDVLAAANSLADGATR